MRVVCFLALMKSKMRETYLALRLFVLSLSCIDGGRLSAGSTVSWDSNHLSTLPFRRALVSRLHIIVGSRPCGPPRLPFWYDSRIRRCYGWELRLDSLHSVDVVFSSHLMNAPLTPYRFLRKGKSYSLFLWLHQLLSSISSLTSTFAGS
jgi:hypothetical protein